MRRGSKTSRNFSLQPLRPPGLPQPPPKHVSIDRASFSHLTDKTGDKNLGSTSNEAFNHQISSKEINLIADQSLIKLDFKGRIGSP